MSVPHPRLQDLRLIPAPIDRFRRPPTQTSMRVPIRSEALSNAHQRQGADAMATVPLPFFWYDPPWHRAPLDRCRFVADLVGQCGVTLAALQRELSSDDGGLEGIAWPRMAPHRCDRAGWTLADSQSAAVVELRLGMNRDARGGYSYSGQQLARWHPGADAARQTDTNRWSPLLFPPEWAELSQMSAKIAQLRCLGEAAVFVSCDEAHADAVLSAACAGGADGVILRCQDDPVAVLRRAKAILDAAAERGGGRPSLWLVAGQRDAIDVVKCLALGASAVSIDWMCDPWLLGDDAEQLTSAQRAALNLGVRVGQTAEEWLQSQVRGSLQDWCTQVAGILQSLFVDDVVQLGPGHLRSVRQ